MFTPKNPYTNLSNAAFGNAVAGGAKKLAKGIDKLGRVIAKPMAQDEAKLAREQAAEQREANKTKKQTTKRANDTRWANKKHKDELARRDELHAQNLKHKAEVEANRTGAAVERATKLKEVREAGKSSTTTKTTTANKKPASNKASAPTKAPKTGKDNLLEPVAPSSPKKPSMAKKPVVDTKAGDQYND